MSGNQPTLISSVQRALRLMDAVAMCDGPVPAKKLAHLTGQALPTTYHLLRTLVYEGYLERQQGGYVLGPHLTGLTGRSRDQRIASRVRPALRMLHDHLGAASYLSSYEDGEISILDIVDSPRAQRVDLWVGFHDAGHATAIGKCILSCLPDSERQEYLSRHKLEDLTPNTITDQRTLLEQLRRHPGYAVDDQEYAVGTVCLAAPVRFPGSETAPGEDRSGLASTAYRAQPHHLGAVAVSMPTRRFPTMLAQKHVLLRAARRIELALETEHRLG